MGRRAGPDKAPPVALRAVWGTLKNSGQARTWATWPSPPTVANF